MQQNSSGVDRGWPSGGWCRPAPSGRSGEQITHSGPWGEPQPRSIQRQPARGTQLWYNQATSKLSPPSELEGQRRGPPQRGPSAAAPGGRAAPASPGHRHLPPFAAKTHRREGGEGRHVVARPPGAWRRVTWRAEARPLPALAPPRPSPAPRGTESARARAPPSSPARDPSPERGIV